MGVSFVEMCSDKEEAVVDGEIDGGTKSLQHLQKKMRIGSIHGRMNYSLSERAFHASDLHEENRRKKLDVKSSSKPDLLGLSKATWNTSVDPEISICVRRRRQNHKHDPAVFNYNFRAEVVPKPNLRFLPKPGRHDFDHTTLRRDYTLEDSKIRPAFRIRELDVNPNLDDKRNWQHSTEVDRKELEKVDRISMARCLRNTKRRNIVIKREGYVGPVERERIRMQKLREEREVARENEEHDDAPLFTNKQPPFTNTDAADEEFLRIPRRKNSKKYKEHFNDGVWEFSQIEKTHVWSCSMNPNPEFRGSSYRIRNPSAWNFASP